jgi:hypothetical protein
MLGAAESEYNAAAIHLALRALALQAARAHMHVGAIDEM